MSQLATANSEASLPAVKYSPNPHLLACEAVMRECEQVECPLTHFFYPGLYVRQIFMKAGTLVVSKVHKTCHPFSILKGVVSVRNGDEVVTLRAGHLGETFPGTHRLLYIIEDTTWVTYHPNPTNETSLEILESLIIEKHETPHLEDFNLAADIQNLTQPLVP